MTEEQKPNEKLKVANVAAALFKARGVKAVAARKLGVDWNTVQRYIKKYPTCQRALEDASEPITDFARKNIIRAIMRGNLGESHWWLAHKDPEFKDVVKNEHTGAGGGPIILEIVYEGEEQQHSDNGRAKR